MTRRTGDGTTFHGLAMDEPAPPRAYCVVYHRERSWHVDLRKDEVVEIGRSRTCGIHLPDEGASRLHAVLLWDGTALKVRDLGSTNGTLLDGRRIPAKRDVTVRSGDEIAIGGAVLIIGLTAPGTALGRRILAHADFEERLGEEVARARRYRRNAGLMMVRLASSPRFDRAGPLGDVVREMDVIGAYGPQDLEILLPEADPTGALAVAERVVAACPGARVGLAVLPQDATDRDALVATARAALRRSSPDAPVSLARAPTLAATASSGAIAVDPAMQRVFALVDRVAGRDISILITGETGSGKEVVARELHRRGLGPDRPFVAVNCAALPEGIVDSELFGHEKGAFTGASGRKKGLFEAADGGTLFLDEVGELGAATQARLLRVLERHEILRVGSTQAVPISVRVVAATNRDLDREVRRGAFREDLLFRLNAFAIVVPPLRDRPGDLEAFTRRFLAETADAVGRERLELTPAAAQCLGRHSWPGNVRELRNVVERAGLLANGDTIDVADLPEKLRPPRAGEAAARGPALLQDSIDMLERDSLVKALEACKGNQTHAARRLGISRRALIYKMEKYGLKPRPG